MSFIKKLCRLLFVWNIPAASDKEMRTADTIVTQAWSRMKDGTPSLGDKIMANVAKQLQEKYGLALLVQEELRMADPELKVVCSANDPSQTGFSTPSWNTYEVAKIQVKYCQRNGWKRAILIASPAHMGRAIWTYQKLGLEILPAPMPKDGYFVPNIANWSHRRKWLFHIREILCRLLFWYWGYI